MDIRRKYRHRHKDVRKGVYIYVYIYIYTHTYLYVLVYFLHISILQKLRAQHSLLVGLLHVVGPAAEEVGSCMNPYICLAYLNKKTDRVKTKIGGSISRLR